MLDWLIWPATAIVGLVVFCLIFFGPIARLISRVRKAGKDGFTFDAAAQDVEPKATPSVTLDLRDFPMLPTMLDQERFIQREIDASQLPAGVTKERVLVRAVAVALVRADMLLKSQTAFGSQVRLLVALAGAPMGMNVAHARAIYDEAVAAYPALHQARTFEEWLRWPVAVAMIEQAADKLMLSQLGADFLKFLVDNRLAHERLG